MPISGRIRIQVGIHAGCSSFCCIDRLRIWEMRPFLSLGACAEPSVLDSEREVRRRDRGGIFSCSMWFRHYYYSKRRWKVM